MRRIIFVIIWGLLCSLSFYLPADVYAQDNNVYRIETIDGNVFVGTLVSEDDNKVVIRTEALGEISIERSQIREMTKIDPDRIKDGKYWFENPQATRYFFTTNAIGIRKGEGYYQNTWIFFNNVNFGLSENISLGGGMVPLFLLGGGSIPIWLLPKISFPVVPDNFHLAAGAMIGGVVGSDTFGMGLVYGISTVGNRDNNLSIGLGYGYAGNEWSNTPMLNVSGMVRTGRAFYLLSENYFFPGTEVNGIILAGIRWAPENFAVDFGLFRPLEETGDFIGLPWLGVTIPFGR